MQRLRSWAGRHADAPAPGREDGSLILGAALACVVVQVALRAWAVYGNWFFYDDYLLLEDATKQNLSWTYLLNGAGGHLTPGGRLFMYWVARTGPLNWGLAATGTLVVVAGAGLAATWALFTLFGRRWAVLVPLNLYLYSAFTIPAMMWLSGALLLVPQQLSFWLALGAWVKYLRGRRASWAALAVVALAVGLAFDVKSVLTIVVLAYLTLSYFTSGRLLARTWRVARSYWVGITVVAAAAVGYLVLYLSRSGPPLQGVSLASLGRLADVMIGSSFATASVGGPWRWSEDNAPTVYADPPNWAQHLSWVVIVLVVVTSWLLRRRALRAWCLLAGYLVILLLLLATSRGVVYGELVGGELRYLNDAAMVFSVSLGAAFLPIVGALESSAPRSAPLLTVDLTIPAAILGACVSIGALTSSLTYVNVWHDDNASKDWVRNLRAAVRQVGMVDLVDTTLPGPVQSPLNFGRNRVSDLAPLATDEVRFPLATDALSIVADDGSLRRADIEGGVNSEPGPRPGCGWLVRQRGRDVPLTGQLFDYSWWLRIGYLSGSSSSVTVSAGDSTVETSISPGLNSLYVQVRGTFSVVRITGLDAGASMCVDTIEAGQPVAGQVAG